MEESERTNNVVAKHVEKKEPVLVGVDDGYAAVKLAWFGPDGAIETAQVASRAACGAGGALSVDGKPLNVYETAGMRFTVDECLRHVEETRFDGYPLHPLNRVLVYHALRTAGFTGPVKIAVGLPLEDYYSVSGEPDREFIARKRKQQRIPVRVVGGGRGPEIVGVRVASEAIAAFIDERAECRGALGSICVVDIGGRTTDIAVVRDGRLLERRTGWDVGCMKAQELFGALLAHELGQRRLPQFAVEAAFRSGRVPGFARARRSPGDEDGGEADLEKLRQTALGATAGGLRMLIDGVVRRWAHEVERVLLVGGGAYLFVGELAEFPNLKVAREPEFANARGMLRWLADLR